MKESELINKMGNATKWSLISEVLSKLVTPVTNMVLARLLTPDAFGIVATISMVFSLADLFSDAGFQKYIVQHEFSDNKDIFQAADVAFWTNLVISIILWMIIAIFSESIAIMVGAPRLGNAIIISCMSLPLTSLSSIQMALYRRNFEFKSLFFVRMAGVVLPFFVTIPLAFITRSYWALIIGTVAGNMVNAMILTVKSVWKPKCYYSIKKLKEMFSFSFWTLAESMAMWLNGNSDTLIVGTFLTAYYLGLYKTSMNTGNQITNILINATVPVLYASLSRVQRDNRRFSEIYFGFINYAGILLVPLGVGFFIYRDFVTLVLLGNQWSDASEFIGLWGLCNSICILIGQFASEAFRAVGKTRTATLMQIIQLFILIPLIYIGAGLGYRELTYFRLAARLAACVVTLILLQYTLFISASNVLKMIAPYFVSGLIMGAFSFLFTELSTSILWSILSICVSIVIYFIILYLLFPSKRGYIHVLIKKLESIFCRFRRK